MKTCEWNRISGKNRSRKCQAPFGARLAPWGRGGDLQRLEAMQDAGNRRRPVQ